MAVQMIAGCSQWQSDDHDGARATIRGLLDYLTAEQAKIGAPDLDPEIALSNMGG